MSTTNLRPHFGNVQAHYDLSDEFFELFLDPTRTYSCAYFEHDDMALEQAQLAKIDLSLGKLGLQPGMTLLDIGCGWGATMRRAVEKYDVNVVGLTLSKNQATRVQNMFDGMDSTRSRRVLLEGWEAFHEPVDRIVSIGAFEHFGFDRYDGFFQLAHDILPDDGVMLLHTITALNGKQYLERGLPLTMERARFTKFILTEIFPGGRLPSVELVESHATKADLAVSRVQSLQQHYAKTLDQWAVALEARRDEAIATQSEEVYQRYMKYLTGCADSFRRGYLDVNQFTVTKGGRNSGDMAHARNPATRHEQGTVPSRGDNLPQRGSHQGKTPMPNQPATNKNMRVRFENIQAHYDVSDEFFALFQDPSRVYSCAYFEPPDITLEQAQIAKIDLNLDKLDLRPGMTLLDIGCGWGATMKRAVEKYDVNVVGLTLSKNQHAYSQQLLDGLDTDRSRRVLLNGWEQFHEPVDRIVSIEAFEHFGFERYDDFFKNSFEIMPDDGRMSIQSSVSFHPYEINARGKKLTFETARFIKFILTEIFPGGRLPSTAMMVEHGEKAGFTVPEAISLRPHYIKTLKIWGDTLEANHDEAIRITSQEVYDRYMKYLRGCEYYFTDQVLDVSLVSYAKQPAA